MIGAMMAKGAANAAAAVGAGVVAAVMTSAAHGPKAKAPMKPTKAKAMPSPKVMIAKNALKVKMAMLHARSVGVVGGGVVAVVAAKAAKLAKKRPMAAATNLPKP